MSHRRRGMPTLYGIIEYWRQRYCEVFPDLEAKYIGWGEPFCFRCGWLAPVDDTLETLREVWNSASGWLERAHLRDLALGGSNGPENLVALCRQCHDIMGSYDCREAAIVYINEGVPVDSWWQMHTDAVFGADAGFLSPASKSKLMRDVYVRWIEYSRLFQAAQNGNVKARERVGVFLARARRRAEKEGREFWLAPDVDLWGDRSTDSAVAEP